MSQREATLGGQEQQTGPSLAGARQSPIDLTGAVPARPHDLAIHYVPSPLEAINTGYTVQVNVAPGSALIAGGKQYALQQFHFHRPSEHTVDGKAAAMELHLVHLDTAGNLAVVGVFLQVGRHHAELERVWAHLPSRPDERWRGEGDALNAADLLPTDRSYYGYVGSLTTPPYTEGVRWFVLSEPVAVSQAQVDRYAALFAMNARPLQPLNGREVSFSRAGT